MRNVKEMSADYLCLNLAISELLLLHNLELFLNSYRHACLSLEETTRRMEEMLLPMSGFVDMLVGLWELDVTV